MNVIEALENWYATICDGDWEHTYGIRIETLDNPGWAVNIDLLDTPLELCPFEAVTIDRSEDDWIRCKKEGGMFKGRGGAKNLKDILEIFIKWTSAM
jgi:hypothetical protein